MENDNGSGTGDPRPGTDGARRNPDDMWAPGGAGQGDSTQRFAPMGGDGYGSYGHSAGPAPQGVPGHPAGPGPHMPGSPAGTYPAGRGGATTAFAPAPGGVPPQQFGPQLYGAQPPAERRPGGGKGLLAAGMVAAMLLSGGVGGVVGASLSDGGGNALTQAVNSDQPANPAPDGTVESVAAKVKPSVVSIDVEGRSGAGEGSGVVLSNDGLVITNNHVVELARNGGAIRVSFSDGSVAEAELVGADPATDIAVVKAKTTTPLTPITLGTSSTLRVGQAVAAVGSPLGLSGTVTTGIVSALERPVRAGGSQSDQSTVLDAVQTDAAVNPGNSGGALVNMNGELVGINSAIASLGGSMGGESGSIGLGFAIPVDQARRIADQLVKQGYATRAVLGVSVSDSEKGNGALVRQVEPAGPAGKAGIPQDAVITRVGERVIEDGDALVAAIRSRTPGETVSVTYTSGGNETKSVDVTLGEAR